MQVESASGAGFVPAPAGGPIAHRLTAPPTGTPSASGVNVAPNTNVNDGSPLVHMGLHSLAKMYVRSILRAKQLARLPYCPGPTSAVWANGPYHPTSSALALSVLGTMIPTHSGSKYLYHFSTIYNKCTARTAHNRIS